MGRSAISSGVNYKHCPLANLSGFSTGLTSQEDGPQMAWGTGDFRNAGSSGNTVEGYFTAVSSLACSSAVEVIGGES